MPTERIDMIRVREILRQKSVDERANRSIPRRVSRAAFFTSFHGLADARQKSTPPVRDRAGGTHPRPWRSLTMSSRISLATITTPKLFLLLLVLKLIETLNGRTGH